MKNEVILKALSGDLYMVVNGFDIVPAGFVTDGASIPRFLWRLLGHPFQSDYIDVFILHDYRYQTGEIPRSVADDEMLAGLEARGMGYVKRYTIYWGVRLFGASHYNSENTNKEV